MCWLFVKAHMNSLYLVHRGYNHKWRVITTPKDYEGILVGFYQGFEKPQNIARPSSCHCYAMGLFSDSASEVLTGIIRRSMSVQILRFMIRKSYSVCKFSQN